MKKFGAIEIYEDITVKEVVKTVGSALILTITFYICIIGVFCI